MAFKFNALKGRPSSKVLYLQIPYELHAEIGKVAREKGSSVRSLVTQMIQHCLKEMKKDLQQD